jgi:RimJ/RimL family protein N-acetyltransferase
MAWAQVRGDMAHSIDFVQKRGFSEKMRGWDLTIKPSQANFEDFEDSLSKTLRTGIEISTLAYERGTDPECYKKLNFLVHTTFRDAPMPDTPTDTSFEQWFAIEMMSPNLLPEGYSIAKDGNRYVGLSAVWRTQKDPRCLYQGLTGVLREYRGRGIASALKLRVLDFAKQNSYEKIRTYNATGNNAMLRVNMRLGFIREVEWITFGKDLT